jgi:hypothetical protein
MGLVDVVDIVDVDRVFALVFAAKRVRAADTAAPDVVGRELVDILEFIVAVVLVLPRELGLGTAACNPPVREVTTPLTPDLRMVEACERTEDAGDLGREPVRLLARDALVMSVFFNGVVRGVTGEVSAVLMTLFSSPSPSTCRSSGSRTEPSCSSSS